MCKYVTAAHNRLRNLTCYDAFRWTSITSSKHWTDSSCTSQINFFTVLFYKSHQKGMVYFTFLKSIQIMILVIVINYNYNLWENYLSVYGFVCKIYVKKYSTMYVTALFFGFNLLYSIHCKEKVITNRVNNYIFIKKLFYSFSKIKRLNHTCTHISMFNYIASCNLFK